MRRGHVHNMCGRGSLSPFTSSVHGGPTMHGSQLRLKVSTRQVCNSCICAGDGGAAD